MIDYRIPFPRAFRALIGTAVLSVPLVVTAQGSAADYARADSLTRRFQNLIANVAERPVWMDATRFWYRKSVVGGNSFLLVDTRNSTKVAAFDHARLSASLNALTNQHYTPITLPFSEISFDGTATVRFATGGSAYSCTLAEYTCVRSGAAPSPTFGAGAGRGGNPFFAPEDEQPTEVPWVEDDGLEAEVFAQRANAARFLQQQQPRGPQSDTNTVRSPDGTTEAYIWNYNIFVRPVVRVDGGRGGRGGGGRGGAPGAGGAAATPTTGTQLSWNGSEGHPYVMGSAQQRSLRWSPDSKKIAAFRVTPGYQRIVRFVESSPADQLQPKYQEQYYQKPGDEVTLREPALFDVASKRQINISNALFPNAYQLSGVQWWADSRAFTFEYNQRGHQVYRVIEVNANTGDARALISDEPKTFFSYRPAADALSEPGSKYRRDMNDGREIIWMSERDGWKQLYLYDGVTGKVKNQITRGEFAVRNIQAVDTAGRKLWFSAGGKDVGQDPYLTKYYRVNFDGSGLVAYTPEDGTHSISFSPDSTFYVDSWTRVDLPPVTVLKRTADQSVVMPIETGDASALVKAGYKMAEPFVAKGRDGVTDIWGVIFKPTNFDPKKKYPVIEQIYAGPQGSFAPKTFAVGGATRTLAEHGFIVVQVDGMGTANRSKAFHDVAWMNVADAGFPDRILWHRAIAAKYPWYDATRVGVYGTSAGGQNALGALLFHPEFYKAGFAGAGCHDNRMDKLWWNEQWMGWPIGPHYAAASNVENASRLQGDLLMVVGELDTNVDPSSTMQVVNALIKANKMFDMLVIPGAGHTNGGAYGTRKMTDFFVRSLLEGKPPKRNSAD
ncbi:MAG: DPP IV N-terminal domain-containing protein [Gemmatimonas sp.]